MDAFILKTTRALVDMAEEIVNKTPNPCEGSRGHLRDDYLWQLREDLRLIEAGDLSDFENLDDQDGALACVADDAAKTIGAWLKEGF